MVRTPTALPILSRGKHRRPRHGACLMEYTSVLAGERFSDSPRCTDPTLAAIARCVNDYSSDAARQRIAPLAADLTTATGAGEQVRTRMARRCLATALARASGSRRQVLTVALLGLDRAAVGAGTGWDTTMLSLDSELALLEVECDTGAAAAYVAELPVAAGEHARRALPVAVEMAVATIAGSGPDSDEVLYRLLVECVADYRTTGEQVQPSSADWVPDSTR
jgi:hypothetical protein